MIGDLRTDALHEALSRAPIEDDTLMALLVLAFAGQNVTVASGARDVSSYGAAGLGQHAARLFDQEGKFEFDMDTLRIAVRSLLIDVLSCRENRSASGVVARVAGGIIGADTFLPNMGTDEFLSCLSRPALEASCQDTSILPRQKVTRAVEFNGITVSADQVHAAFKSALGFAYAKVVTAKDVSAPTS